MQWWGEQVLLRCILVVNVSALVHLAGCVTEQQQLHYPLTMTTLSSVVSTPAPPPPAIFQPMPTAVLLLTPCLQCTTTQTVTVYTRTPGLARGRWATASGCTSTKPGWWAGQFKITLISWFHNLDQLSQISLCYYNLKFLKIKRFSKIYMLYLVILLKGIPLFKTVVCFLLLDCKFLAFHIPNIPQQNSYWM